MYGFTNYRASGVSESYRFWMEWELLIPQWPPAIVVYSSILLLNLVPLFVLDEKGLKRLAQAFGGSILVAGLVFYFFPAPVAFAREVPEGLFGPLFQGLYSLDPPNNTFPSLHIALSFLVVRSCTAQNPKLKLSLNIWFALICLSVLLTHQHHVLDILGGWVLAGLAHKRTRFGKR